MYRQYLCTGVADYTCIYELAHTNETYTTSYSTNPVKTVPVLDAARRRAVACCWRVPRPCGPVAGASSVHAAAVAASVEPSAASRHPPAAEGTSLGDAPGLCLEEVQVGSLPEGAGPWRLQEVGSALQRGPPAQWPGVAVRSHCHHWWVCQWGKGCLERWKALAVSALVPHQAAFHSWGQEGLAACTSLASERKWVCKMSVL